MTKRTILISILLLLLLALFAACIKKKPDESNTEGTTPLQVITEEVTTEEPTSEKIVMPEQVDDYTIELREDEVIEIN